MTRHNPDRPTSIYFLIGAMFLQALSGLAGGFGLISDPTGGHVQMPLTWLEGTPFASYLIPGIILFTVLGVLPMLVTYGLWRERTWSWFGSLLVGASLTIWIAVQISMIGYFAQPPLQVIYGGLGLFLLTLTLSPSARRDLGVDDAIDDRSAENTRSAA